MKNKLTQRMLCLLLCTVMLLGLLPLGVSAVVEISTANITITKPVGGESPDLFPDSSDSEKYYADLDTWALEAYGSATPMGAGSQFNTHELYSLRVIFRAKAGYSFAEDCVFTINGEGTGCYGLDGDEFRYIYWYAADPNKPTYTVHFDADGGAGSMDDVNGVFAEYELPANGFTAPAGKFFTGWFVGGYMKDPGTSVVVLKDTTIYACWKNIPAPGNGYTVTYNGGGAGGSMASHEKTDFYGELTLPECAFTAPAGKSFAGWRIGNDNWEPGDKIIVSVNTTVNAIWKDIPQTYTVGFDANGGTGSMASANNVSGKYTLPPNGFTAPAGKQFKCWSVNGSEKNPFESIDVTADVTVQAVWKDITATSYTVSFDPNGGTGSMASVSNAPSSYSLPQCGFTAPAGKQFKCWSVGPLGDEYDPGDKITVSQSLTVKAIWETITSSKQQIFHVEATSSDLNTIPKLYGLLKEPSFTVTQGDPAYINATSGNLRWQKKIGGVWTTQYSGRFTPGEWRITSALRIDGEGANQYELGNPTTLTVNGQDWIVENGGKPNVHPDYSHANILSPVFTIVDDPNIQPPVAVPAVHMVLKGYQAGAQIAAATVETDAMVDVQIVAFLKAIDTNGDGQPDSSEVATGAFEENVVYAIALSLRAKNGYDISGLMPQAVSLDRSLVDTIEESGENETFNGIYILDDIVQYTASFETNGGSTVAPVKISRGKALTPPAEPSRAYYAFAGWYSDNGLTQAYDFNTPVSANITLYAKWTPSPVGGMFLMTIDLNGGTSSMALVGEVPANSSIYLNDNLSGFVTPPSGKVLAGYEVNGVPKAAGSDHLVTENVTVKFLWKDAPIPTYTVSFDANGGTGAMADVTGVSGDYTLPANGFTAPSGKQFKGWSVSGKEKAAGDKISITADTTVTALWEDIPHVCDPKPVPKDEPDCEKDGKEAYYKCNGCGKCYEDSAGKNVITDIDAWGKLPAKDHTPEDDYIRDEREHAKRCSETDCGKEIAGSRAAHEDKDRDGKCDVCGYAVANVPTGDDSTPALWITVAVAVPALGAVLIHERKAFFGK